MNVDNRYRTLLESLLEPKTYDHGGDKTICYLTFGTDEIINVKRKLNEVWIDLAKNKGLKVTLLSLHEVLKDFFKEDEYRIEAGEDAVEYEDETIEVYHSLGENLKNQEVIEDAILEAQQKVDSQKGVLFINRFRGHTPVYTFRAY